MPRQAVARFKADGLRSRKTGLGLWNPLNNAVSTQSTQTLSLWILKCCLLCICWWCTNKRESSWCYPLRRLERNSANCLKRSFIRSKPHAESSCAWEKSINTENTNLQMWYIWTSEREIYEVVVQENLNFLNIWRLYIIPLVRRL